MPYSQISTYDNHDLFSLRNAQRFLAECRFGALVRVCRLIDLTSDALGTNRMRRFDEH